MMLFEAIERKGTGAIKWDDTVRRFNREGLLPLWVADMDFAAPVAVQEALAQRIGHPVYGYSLYSDAFFEAIQWWYEHHFGWPIEREWIVPDHGVVVSINTAITALTDAGDGVMIQTPIYPPFMTAVESNHRILLENRLHYKEGRYTIDWEDFEAKAREASMFLLCSPHNPTTRAWSSEELERMAAICRENNVVIVADEIHSDVVHVRKHVPIGTLPEARRITLTLHAPSKTFNIAGLNQSYVIIPDPEIRAAYQKRFAQIGLPHGNPLSIAALTAAYSPEGAAWLEELMEYLEDNMVFVRTYLGKYLPQIVPVETEATFLMWLDCRALEMDDAGLEHLFFDRAHLALNPGISFGQAGSGFMRLNIGTSRSLLEQALEQLRVAVEGKRG